MLLHVCPCFVSAWEKPYFLLKPRMIALPQGNVVHRFDPTDLPGGEEDPNKVILKFVKMMNDQQPGIFPPLSTKKL